MVGNVHIQPHTNSVKHDCHSDIQYVCMHIKEYVMPSRDVLIWEFWVTLFSNDNLHYE